MPAADRAGLPPQENAASAKHTSARPEDWNAEFREAFESLEIPNERFHHRDHIRLAWIYCSHLQEDEALLRMVLGIRAFAATTEPRPSIITPSPWPGCALWDTPCARRRTPGTSMRLRPRIPISSKRGCLKNITLRPCSGATLRGTPGLSPTFARFRKR